MAKTSTVQRVTRRLSPRRWPRWAQIGVPAAGTIAVVYLAWPKVRDAVAAVGPLAVPLGFWPRTLELLGGRPADPNLYRENIGGFQLFLQASRVDLRKFPVAEIVTPHQPGTARALGYTSFVPPKVYWQRTAALVALSNWATEASASVDMRNHWRPRAYNDAVGGVEDSAHVEAAAVDLDFGSAGDRQRAEDRLKALQLQYPWLKMGLGIGARTLHVDILSSLERRPAIWCYEGFTCDQGWS